MAAQSDSRSELVTLPGVHPPPVGLDSLLGDEDDDTRGPEWCVDLGDQMRAMNKFELWLALGTGDYAPTTLVWRIGRERWQPARDIPELACALKVHAQTLMMAARAAEQAAEARTPSLAPGDRSSRESLPRVLTPESSLLVAQMEHELARDANTPDQPIAAPDAALVADDRRDASDGAEATTMRPPLEQGGPRSRRRAPMRKRSAVARFATGIAAVAGTLLFLMSRGDANRMTASLVPAESQAEQVEVTAEPAAAPLEPAVVAESQAAPPAPSSAPSEVSSADTKAAKKSRKRLKDGVAGSVAGVEADRRGRARQRRTR